MYYRKQDNADGSATIRLIAGDTTSANVNIDLRPQGSGKFLVNGPTELTDVNFFLADDQNPDKQQSLRSRMLPLALVFVRSHYLTLVRSRLPH